MNKCVDLNADLGEGGPADEALLALVTSANVACGAHAGDAAVMLRTLELAAKLGVRVGAHPGHADRPNFGRVEIPMLASEVSRLVNGQVVALLDAAERAGVAVTHLKPHGALYHQASRDDAFGDPVVEVCERFELTLVGLPGSRLQQLAEGRCPFVAEGFADRAYQADGSLVPRSSPGAFVHDPAEAVLQVERLLREQCVGTICVHGDNPHALEFVRAVRTALLAGGFKIQAFA